MLFRDWEAQVITNMRYGDLHLQQKLMDMMEAGERMWESWWNEDVKPSVERRAGATRP